MNTKLNRKEEAF